MLDEGLAVLTQLWSGEEFTYKGQHYQLSQVQFLPKPLQQPRIPIWIAGFWPNKNPIRRAAKFDDVIAATTPDAAVKQMLAGSAAMVMVGGHTHIQMIRRYEDAYLVNVGSVGLPGVNAGSPELPSNQHVHWAEYGVLGIESGRLSIELRRTPLDMSAVLKAVPASGMPHVEWWIQKWESN